MFLYDIGLKEWRIVDIDEIREREHTNESYYISFALNLVESI